MNNLCNKCEPFETEYIESCKKENCMYKQKWDAKFGIIENKVIDGVGKDAPIVTNAKGGKQAKAPMAMHLIDPIFLENWADRNADALEYELEDEAEEKGVDVSELKFTPEKQKEYDCYRAIWHIAGFMQSQDIWCLECALDFLCENDLTQIIKIAKTLLEGVEHYPANNWRLIPQEEHINHALIHIVAHLSGDTQDDHIEHALCRLMMAGATETSEGFKYTEYLTKLHEER